MPHALSHLNSSQHEAVRGTCPHILVLAGAGSGKTRVLVERIAWLVQNQLASPMEVLAVTFTNKAAKEMLGRLDNMLEVPAKGLWIGTFHGLAHRFLRQHYEAADLPQSFQILDSDDQLRLIKRIEKEMNLDDERFPPKQAQWFINNQKDNGRRAAHIQPNGEYFTEIMLSIYQQYEAFCQRNGLVDFTELLLRCHETLRDNADLLAHYRRRFRYLLVDEFQDTNTLQYAWLRLLAGDDNHLFAVGDDDQSIYSWRGAKIENIHRFSQDFPDTQTIYLEQNYRSTETILSAANALIANNDHRMGKKLWTQDNPGAAIEKYAAFNEFDEATFVAERIMQYRDQGTPLNEMAILYRANALSRVLEDMLNRTGLPYRIYGGHKFFSRAEIKDALAYLRLINFPNDDPAFERIVNQPPRGIGHATVDKIRDYANIHQISMWHASRQLIDESGLAGRASKALSNFLQLIDDLKKQHMDQDLGEQTESMLAGSGLIDYFQQDRSEKGHAKVENLHELVTATRQFTPDPNSLVSSVDDFLSQVTLDTGDDGSNNEASVQMMTLHSAKGLEFSVVFIVGLEEGVFPHHMCLDTPTQLEEERRLCYVGFTRAKKQLIVTHAEQRRMNGRELFHRASRFLSEIPAHLLQEIRFRNRPQRASKPYGQGSNHPEGRRSHGASGSSHVIDQTGLKLGQTVTHPKFGSGTIINAEGSGESARIQVQFNQHGTKWLVLQYANLT